MDLTRFELPGQITAATGQGGLPKLDIRTPWSEAEIYLHGAHVTRFQKAGEAPLLFLSAESLYQSDKPIRGGIPVIFPWFGNRDGFPAHGYARTTAWDLVETKAKPDGAVTLRFTLPADESGLVVFYDVTISDRLELSFAVENTGAAASTFEACLHTYFQIGDIHTATLTGLRGDTFLDKLQNNAQLVEENEAIRIDREVDRIYLDSTGTVEIHDPTLGRLIRVAKTGSASTVVWNPWIAKAAGMSDFGNEEYLRMVCVESGNIAGNQLTLAPGARSVLGVEVTSAPLAG